jgi:cytosine/adenosine deaminase-related metal-dependent hydrolase
LSIAQDQSPLPALPSDIPKNAVVRVLLTDKTPSGQDAVWTTPDGVIHEFFQFNDRGRGPKIYSSYRVDGNEVITWEESRGVDYMKKPVEEHFQSVENTVTWKNESEDEKRVGDGKSFYIDLDGGPESGALLLRALLKSKTGRLPVLPGGEAKVRQLESMDVEGNGRKVKATLYAIDGLAYTPSYLWLDENQRLFASVGGWSGLVPEGFESSVPLLRAAQRKIENAHEAELARKLTHKPAGDLIIKNVSIFDSETAAIKSNQRVTVRGERIRAVEAERGQAIPKGSEVIDGEGETLLPGLWDMHAHLFPQSAYLNIAAGITSVRDLGNPIEELTKLRKEIASGEQIGPRVVCAGFIDGPGPFEGPIKVLASTREEAIQRVDEYARLGYAQIKIYSSVKPELVPVIAAEAHKLGLRVSGHVPSGMIAEQFVRDGADEIQHMNFIFLNFMPDVKETRTPARFTEPGKRGADLDLSSPAVNQFIAFLKARHTVVDPTMATWEDTYLDRPGRPELVDAYIFDRLPVQVQRGSRTGGGALNASDPVVDKQYRASYANMLRMLKKLYDNGIQIVAGTDQGSGYALHRELEIYVEAGIPAPEVLRMATLKAAQLMRLDGDFGSIAAGKYADLVLVKGNPAANISDIRRMDLVVKNGNILRPVELYAEYGIRAP